MLVECRDCKKMISSEATSCPQCGCPKAQAAPTMPPAPAAPSREIIAAALKDKSNVLNGLDRMILAATGVLAATFALTANSGFFQWLATQMPDEDRIEMAEIVLLFWLLGLLCTTLAMFHIAYRKITDPSIGLTAKISEERTHINDWDIAMATLECYKARAIPLAFLVVTLMAASITFFIMLWPA